MMIEAIAWKWPGIQISLRGAQIYTNIVLHPNSIIPLPTEAEVSTAIIEYQTYLSNKEMNQAKLHRIKYLRNKQVDLALTAKIIQINTATSQSQIDAVDI